MRLKFTLPIIIIILIAGLYFYPVAQQENITINKSLFDVYNQLHNAENWAKWDSYFKGENGIKQTSGKGGFTITTPSKNIKVTFLDSFVFGIKDADVNYDIVLLQQKLDNATNVLVSFKTNLLSTLIPGRSHQYLKKTVVNDLKNYLEDPLSYYGINLKKQTIAGADMMVCQTVIKPGDEFAEIKKSVTKIYNNVPAGELENGDKIFLQITPVGENLNLFVGVVVKKQLLSTQGLTYMHLPGQKMLMVNYSGRYADRRKAYAGAQAYIRDHKLKSATPPIEIYNTNGLPSSDTSQVNAQIIFSAY